MAVLIYKIYKITNLINGKIYVGQTMRSIEERFKEHCCTDSAIGNAIRKYGKGNFKLELIAECETNEAANELEMYWIKELNCKAPNGYNLTDGGERRSGFKHTDEEKAKIAAFSKAYWSNSKNRLKQSEFFKAYRAEHPFSEGTKSKISDAKKNHEVTLKTRIKISISKKEYYKKYPVSEKTRKELSEQQKKLCENPNHIDNKSKVMKKYYEEHPEEKLKRVEPLKRYWEKIRAQREQENNSKD